MPTPLAFNTNWYLKQNPDVAAAIEAGAPFNAVEHFQLYGRMEGRSASPLFDPQQYVTNNPDVAEAVSQGLITAWDHFEQFGGDEGRSPTPLFNGSFYLQQNPDVAAAIEQGILSSAAQHFVLYGQSEPRPINPAIDLSKYVSANPDIATAAASGVTSALNHLLEQGVNEGRNLGNGVVLSEFSNDPAFTQALSNGNVIQALGRMESVAPFLPTFERPSGWTPPANTSIPADFVPPADSNLRLQVPQEVNVPDGVILPPVFQPKPEPSPAPTSEQQQQLIALTTMIFNAPPGAAFLTELEGYLEQGLSLEQVAINLANTDIFNAQFAGIVTDKEKIDLVLSFVGIDEASDAYEEAFKHFQDSLDAGISPGLALRQAASFLSTTEDEAFGDSATIFKNKVDVGFAHSVTLGLNSTDLDELKEAVSNVTQDPATVTQQIEQLNQSVGGDDAEEEEEEPEGGTGGGGVTPTFSVLQSVDAEGDVSFSFSYATQPVTLSLSADDHLVFTDAQGRQHDTGRVVSDIATAGIPPVAMSIATAQADGLLGKVPSYAIEDSAQHLIEALPPSDSQQLTVMVPLPSTPTLAQQALFHASSVVLTDEQAIELTTLESLFQALTDINVDMTKFDVKKLDVSGITLSGGLDDFTKFSVGNLTLSDVSYTLSDTKLAGVSEDQAAIIEGAQNADSVDYSVYFEVSNNRLTEPSLILENYDFERGDIIGLQELEPISLNVLNPDSDSFDFRSGWEGVPSISPNAGQDLVLQLDGDENGRQITLANGNSSPARLVFDRDSLLLGPDDETSGGAPVLGVIALVANSDATLEPSAFATDNASVIIDENLANGVLFVYLGGEGEQTLISGVGINLLKGGVGNDTFVFNMDAGPTAVIDFELGAGTAVIEGVVPAFNDTAPATLNGQSVMLTVSIGDKTTQLSGIFAEDAFSSSATSQDVQSAIEALLQASNGYSDAAFTVRAEGDDILVDYHNTEGGVALSASLNIGEAGANFSGASAPEMIYADKLDFSDLKGIAGYDSARNALVDEQGAELVGFSDGDGATIATFIGSGNSSVNLIGINVDELLESHFIF